jgi:CRP/FNR family transcriptional regulator, cyclic AMP receptor protein
VATLTTPELLRRVPLFEHLSDTQAISLMGALEKKRFKRSDLLVEAGQKSNMLFVILSGTVHVVVTHPSGKKLVLATLGAGDCIGEMSLLDNQPHSATVTADTQVDALVLTRDGFNSCILHNAQMAASVMRGLVQRLRKANQKIASMALLSVFGRVARHLMDIAEQDETGQLLVKKKISHAAIAREVGASREMVSKALKEFESQAFIYKLDNGMLGITERRSSVRP